ncbi:MAG: AraC family transcriptional regulator [Myxococcota bacterium]
MGADVTELARAGGVTVRSFVCRAGPSTAPFDEQHGGHVVALVLAGSFRYRTSPGDATLVPGAALLGNPGQPYRCSHEYCQGDRCLSFELTPALLASVAADAGAAVDRFVLPALPAGALPASLVASARVAAAGADPFAVQSAAVTLAAHAFRTRPGRAPPPSRTDAVRASEAARLLDRSSGEALSLEQVAAKFDTSPYHFHRTFRAALGITPHQYLVQARLRRAARLLATTELPVTDIAFSCGFGDLTHFIRTFRADAGASPGRWRAAHRGGQRP